MSTVFADIAAVEMRVVAELFPWDAGYDVQAIALELDDTYRLVGNGEWAFKRIPEHELADVIRTYDHSLTEA